jgi:hypothetical protein
MSLLSKSTELPPIYRYYLKYFFMLAVWYITYQKNGPCHRLLYGCRQIWPSDAASILSVCHQKYRANSLLSTWKFGTQNGSTTKNKVIQLTINVKGCSLTLPRFPATREDELGYYEVVVTPVLIVAPAEFISVVTHIFRTYKVFGQHNYHGLNLDLSD